MNVNKGPQYEIYWRSWIGFERNFPLEGKDGGKYWKKYFPSWAKGSVFALLHWQGQNCNHMKERNSFWGKNSLSHCMEWRNVSILKLVRIFATFQIEWNGLPQIHLQLMTGEAATCHKYYKNLHFIPLILMLFFY